MNLRPRRPSPAMVTAVLALVVALGGMATAASGLITGKQIAPETITGANVKDRSLRAADLAAGALQAGPRGRTGARGARGVRGARGATGAAGAAGAPGAQGPIGPAGPAGKDGAAGKDGQDATAPVIAYRLSSHVAAPPLTAAQAKDPYPVTTKTPRNVTAGAACDPGTYPVGGGVLPSDSRIGAISVSALIPVVNPDPTKPSGYVASVDNHTSETQGFQVYVNCVKATPDTEKPTSDLPASAQAAYTRVLQKEAAR